MKRSAAVLFLLGFGFVTASPSAEKPGAPARPGTSKGVTVLPNGWKLSPAGRHMTLGDLPMAMAASPDGKLLAIVHGGYAKPTVKIVDLERLIVKATVPLEDAWLGLAWSPSGHRLYQAAGAVNAIDEIGLEKGRWKVLGRIALGPPLKESFLGGLALTPDGRRLFVVEPFGQKIMSIDLETRRVERTTSLPSEPYTCAVSPDATRVYISLWGGSKILILDAATLQAAGEILVGEHPNALALSRDGRRLFVACANTNAVWSIDTAARKADEQISVALFPASPEGATPNALGLSPDGRRLLVANADNNAVAIVDVERPGASRVEGFVPTGWYPTAAQFDRDGRRILVLSGKGLGSEPNPRGPQPGVAAAPGQYVGEMLTGPCPFCPSRAKSPSPGTRRPSTP